MIRRARQAPDRPDDIALLLAARWTGQDGDAGAGRAGPAHTGPAGGFRTP